MKKGYLKPVNQVGLESYKIFRDYLEHEDELLNNRVTWLLLTNAFLFAAVGFTVRVIPEFPVASLYVFVFASALGGISIACLGVYSIGAAISASDSLEELWRAELERSGGLLFPVDTNSVTADQKASVGQVAVVVPGIRGGGAGSAVNSGRVLAKFLPPGLIVFWAAVVIGLGVAWHYEENKSRGFQSGTQDCSQRCLVQERWNKIDLTIGELERRIGELQESVPTT